MSSLLAKIAILKDLIDQAELKIQNARKILTEISGSEENVDPEFLRQKATILQQNNLTDSETRIIEGVFNGQEMIDAQGNIYPVPVNYASKSKLITGDCLKLTIGEDGRFLYKQIGPAKRKYVSGPLSYEDGVYKVLANGKAYKVLLASVTYFKAEIGDEVTVIIPEEEPSEWAAIDVVLPKFENIIIKD